MILTLTYHWFAWYCSILSVRGNQLLICLFFPCCCRQAPSQTITHPFSEPRLVFFVIHLCEAPQALVPILPQFLSKIMLYFFPYRSLYLLYIYTQIHTSISTDNLNYVSKPYQCGDMWGQSWSVSNPRLNNLATIMSFGCCHSWYSL